MSSCGCTTSGCGCTVVGGAGASVQRIGDSFVVNVTADIPEQNLFIQQSDPGARPYPYVWWQIDGAGNPVTEWIYTP